MQVLQEVYGLEGGDLWTAASGFGGGIARYQSVCGAISGAVIALGVLEGRRAADLGPKKVSDPVRFRSRALIDAFKARFGGIECRDLTEHDFNTAAGYEAHRTDKAERKRCEGYVAFVVETLASEFQQG